METIKILLIDDNQSMVRDVMDACLNTKFDIVEFKPKHFERSEILRQFEEVCRHQFNFALLDFELWNYLTGDLLVDTLKISGIPFIAFSSKSEHNALLLKLGAKNSIYKDGLSGSRGFNKVKFIEILEEMIL